MSSFFLLSSQLRSSSVSVVFDFNDSLNDFAPVSLILLSVDVKIKEKNKFVDESLLCAFLSFSFTHQIKHSERCI